MNLSTLYRFPLCLFVDVEPTYGESQIRIPVATAGRDVRRYLTPLSPNSTLCIMSYNFSKREWEDKGWLDWLMEQYNKGIEIRVIGGPKIEAESTLEQLVDKKIIKFAKLERPVRTHFVFSDNPRQLWIESYHKRGYARSCFFTDRPYDRTWQSARDIFNELFGAKKEVSS